MKTISKRLLVTGGAGFIGVNTARHFVKKGWEVVILDDFSRKGTELNVAALKKEVAKIRVVRADIVTDVAIVKREVSKADAVIHLAAQVAVTTSIADPAHDLKVNILGSFNVLEAIRNSRNRPALLYASTNKVYGSLPHLAVAETKTRSHFKDASARKYGVSENEPLDFHSPYGCSKGAADQYVLDYARIYNLQTVVFRQSCVYGEHQFGMEDQGWVAWFTIAALKGRPITIYGNGKQVRDVLYVGDLVDLYERAIRRIKTVSGRAYNIGGGPGNTISLLECLNHLQQELKLTIPLSFSALRAGDQPIFVADVRKAGLDLGWHPNTAFENGFARMLAWMERNKEDVLTLL